MEKKFSLLIILILLVSPLINAGNYGSGAYSAGDYGVGEVPVTPSGGGDGGGGTTSTYECLEDSDCDINQSCDEYKCYDYECHSNAECNTEEGEVCLNNQCRKLFDIKIIDFQPKVELGTEFEFTYFLKGMADISGDVEIHFWIEKDGEVVTSGHDTIYMGEYEEKTDKTRINLPTTIESGVYTFFIQVVHEDYQANAHRTIEIFVDKETATITGKEDEKSENYLLILALIVLFVFIIAFIFYIERKKMKKLIVKEKRFIKRYKVTHLSVLLFIIFIILIYYLSSIGVISLFVKEFFINIFSWFKDYFYYIAGSVLGLVVLITTIILFKKKHIIKKFKVWQKKKKELVKKEITKPKSEKKSKLSKPKSEKLSYKYKKLLSGHKTEKLLSKYKKLFWIFLIIIILAGISSYLFYARIFILEQLQILLNNIVFFVQNIWKNIYSSFGNKYFYLVLGLIVLIMSVIIAKKNHMFEKLKSWNKKRNEKKIKRKTGEKFENIRLKKQIIGKFKNFKEIIEKHKLLFIILGILVILIIIFGVLFYYGIITIEQLDKITNDSLNFIQTRWQNTASSISNFAVKIGDFIQDYSPYIISSILGIIILLIAYSKRKSLAGFFRKLFRSLAGFSKGLFRSFKKFPKKEKTIISIILVAVMLAILIFFLFYSKILSVEKLSNFFLNIYTMISEFGKNIADGISNLLGSVTFWLYNAYANSLDWIVQNYVYLISAVLVIILGVISYLKRHNIRDISEKIKYFVIEHKKLFLILLILIIVSAVIFYLFYSKIITIGQLDGILNSAKIS